MTNNEPIEKHKFAMAEAELYLGKKVALNGEVYDADYLSVQYVTGQQHEVLIFTKDGVRQVGRVVPTIEFRSVGSAVSSSASTHYRVAEVDESNTAEMLTIYDRFDNRTQKESS